MPQIFLQKQNKQNRFRAGLQAGQFLHQSERRDREKQANYSSLLFLTRCILLSVNSSVFFCVLKKMYHFRLQWSRKCVKQGELWEGSVYQGVMDVLHSVPQLTGFVCADTAGRTVWPCEASTSLMTALMSRTPAGLFFQMGSSGTSVSGRNYSSGVQSRFASLCML